MTRQEIGDIGVIGMGVMGHSLALNIESRGYSVSIFNRSSEKTKEVMEKWPKKNLIPTYTLEEFVQSLHPPRRILIMVKAGKPTDMMIEAVKSFLDEGDILIDGGNAFFEDTIRRNEMLNKEGFYFIGAGVSGGEEGALKGPSIMPGGQRKAYDLVAPILREIAAVAEGEPCVTYIGPNGAGHYVKMVHNGIEYGDMQLIAEVYMILKKVLGFSDEEQADVFTDWNKGELDSYLINITKNILKEKDEDTGKPILEVILDKAGQKGTGKWTSQSSLDLGVPLSVITQSVFERFLSARKKEREYASERLKGPEGYEFNGDKKAFIESVRRALYFSKIISYAQGFAQMKSASEEYKWDLKYGEIAKIFRAGCIIRARFLQKITEAYNNDENLPNLLLDPYFKGIADRYQGALREVISEAVKAGVPTPALASAISYYDSYRSLVLPANLIQAQRDYFGAHTFERVDKLGSFHRDWPEVIE